MKKKVLLMGKSGSGKTSMRSIIFSNYIARDTRRLGATIDVEHSHVRFLGNLVLNLWDCGGQESFMENYFASQRDHIFRNVEVLIYVFDVESREHDKDMRYYQSCLEAISANSKDAKIFCLIHKMDLVPDEMREALFQERYRELRTRSEPLEITAFATTIWDETLYRAWSSIVYSLIPNVRLLETHLRNFCRVCEADEVVLFERTTFLVISSATVGGNGGGKGSGRADSESNAAMASNVSAEKGASPSQGSGAVIAAGMPDAHRFEKISNIIKQFKLSCSKFQTQFKSMEVFHPKFTAFVDVLTNNTYVLVLVSDPDIQSACTQINICAARKHFDKLEQSNPQYG